MSVTKAERIAKRVQGGAILPAEVAGLSHRDLCLLVANVLDHPDNLNLRMNSSPLIKELKQRISHVSAYVQATASTKPQSLQELSNQLPQDSNVGRYTNLRQKLRIITTRMRAGTILPEDLAGLTHRDLCILVAKILSYPKNFNSNLNNSILIKELMQRIRQVSVKAADSSANIGVPVNEHDVPDDLGTGVKKMAMTAAERQAKYRERVLKNSNGPKRKVGRPRLNPEGAAMTAAERAAKHRKHAFEDPDGPLLTYVQAKISPITTAKLDRLQRATGLNQQQCIEEAINWMADSFKNYSQQKRESLTS